VKERLVGWCVKMCKRKKVLSYELIAFLVKKIYLTITTTFVGWVKENCTTTIV